jgi:hypothetical protein
VSQAQFTEVGTFSNEGGDGSIVEILAIVKVDLQNVATVASEGDDTPVTELRASIQF